MDEKNWNQIITSFPEPHILQSYQWGQVKSQFGWEPHYKIWGSAEKPDAAALILQRTISLRGFAPRLRILYAPKGPMIRDWNSESLKNLVFSDLKAFAHQQGAFLLKIDPDISLGTGIPGAADEHPNPVGTTLLQELRWRKWIYSNDQIQFRNTVQIDLSLSEDELLAQMKQKTRYNIRLAGRKGVTVRLGSSADFEFLYRMYAETSLRDGFVIRNQDYYHTVWQTFFSSGMLAPLIAEVEGEPVAGVMIFKFFDRAYYMHGMSRPIHRNKMPTYLLQWEAMRRMKAAGCGVYDLWGAPEVFDETDSLWGVYRFKRGLGGEVVRTLGAYDLPIKPVFFRLYTQVLPKILDIMRRRGTHRTKDLVS